MAHTPRPVAAAATAVALLAALDVHPAAAQPSPLLSFFVTSEGNGAAGADYGGLAGADARCQSLAAAVGRGDRVWRAYLSVAPIPGAGDDLVHARDRIGPGPWRNAAGVVVAPDLATLHAAGIDPAAMLDEIGAPVPSNEHDVLTGSHPDGTARTEFPGNPDAPAPTCFNWTSNAPDAWGFAGHADWIEGQSWNSQHEVLCDEAGLGSTAGTGRLYCFALPAVPIFADGFESGGTGEWEVALRSRPALRARRRGWRAARSRASRPGCCAP